jgi:protein TonB
MFEQSTIASAPKGKRFLATCVGFAGQGVLVTIAILAPMVFPQVLPHAALSITIAAPGPPPGPPPKGDAVVRPRKPALTRFVDTRIHEPANIPATVAILRDEPAPAAQGYGVIGGIDSGSRGGGGGGSLVESIIGEGTPAVAAPPAPAVRPTPPPAAAQPPRYRVGGVVKMAHLVSRVEPRYPTLARQMHVSGVVELEGVIGTDGRIRELNVRGGHPLLVHAAVEAVRQWIYEPTTLNGTPVEVIAPITITFRLN